MIDGRSEELKNVTIPPPRFDGNSCACAKPVEPIRRDALSFVRENVGRNLASFTNRVSGQSRALLLVVAIGLITGAMGGMLLVRIAKDDQPREEANAPASSLASGAAAVENEQLDAFANELQQPVMQSLRSSSRVRVRGRANRARAYRVAVIH